MIYKLKVVVFFICLFSVAYGKNIYLESVNIYNLPNSYKIVFEEFLKNKIKNQSTNFDKNNDFKLTVDIEWIAFSYNFCLNLYLQDNPYKTLCFTSRFAEQLLDDFEKNINNFTEIEISETERKYGYTLLISARQSPLDRKCKIISSKGDYLVNYKYIVPFIEGTKKNISITRTTISADLVVLDEINATYLLKKILNGYKIDKIMIKHK